MHEAAIEQSTIQTNNKLDVINLFATSITKTSTQTYRSSRKIIDLIQDRYNNGKLFFSIEISPVTGGQASSMLNYNDFMVQPLFTAITWWSNVNLNEEHGVTASPAIKLSKAITSTAVLSHISCHDLLHSHLNDILTGNGVLNVLALRGGNYNRFAFFANIVASIFFYDIYFTFIIL